MNETLRHLENLGAFPYESDASREFEKRLIRVVTRLYRQLDSTSVDIIEVAKEGPTAEKTEDLMNEHYDMDILFLRHS